jgi:hypothetical protein
MNLKENPWVGSLIVVAICLGAPIVFFLAVLFFVRPLVSAEWLIPFSLGVAGATIAIALLAVEYLESKTRIVIERVEPLIIIKA